MQIKIRKWGNSASVRIPAPLMRAARLELNTTVDIREEEGRIVIEPVHEPNHDLDELISAITPDNLHEEAEFGGAVGKEAL